MMMRIGVDRLRRDDEINRHDARALMQHLEERVLPVRARLAPDDGGRRHLHRLAVARHRLAVRLHVELLQIGGEAREALVVRDHRMGGIVPRVAIPDSKKPHQDRQIVLQRRFREVPVDVVPAAQKREEVVAANGDGKRQSDGRPDRIAAAHPVPEAEHAI